MISLANFLEDQPWEDTSGALSEYRIKGQIEGVKLQRLVTHEDGRGDLTVLLSSHYSDFSPHPPQVYMVTAAPGSIRAWVYHRLQHDRLAYTAGDFTIALFDLRPESVTFRQVNIIRVGAACKTLVTIPPYVVHGVQNAGPQPAIFVNMPTRAYDPAKPDKARLPYPHPGVPFRFE